MAGSQAGEAPSQASRPVRIGMLWHSAASGNLGVAALTVANLALARASAVRCGLDPHFTIIGPRERGPANVAGDGIDIVALDMRYLARRDGYRGLVDRLDCLLDIGAGDSFADIYSRRRFAMIYATKRLARARGKPLLFSPQTIGPFTHQPYRWLAGDAMAGADGVVARDPDSAALARTLAPRARVTEAIDVAFALPFTPQQRAGDRIDIGLNVSGLLASEARNGTNRYGLSYDHNAMFDGLIAALSARPDVRVHLICHVNAPGTPEDDDGAVADALARANPDLIRVPDFTSASEAKSYISGLDLLVAGRMHACIAAYSSGVPVIPVAYSRKFSGLFGGVLGYQHMLPTKGHDTQSAIAFVTDLIDRRAALAEEIKEGSKRVAGRLALYEAELDRFLGGVAAGR